MRYCTKHHDMVTRPLSNCPWETETTCTSAGTVASSTRPRRRRGRGPASSAKRTRSASTNRPNESPNAGSENSRSGWGNRRRPPHSKPSFSVGEPVSATIGAGPSRVPSTLSSCVCRRIAHGCGRDTRPRRQRGCEAVSSRVARGVVIRRGDLLTDATVTLGDEGNLSSSP